MQRKNNIFPLDAITEFVFVNSEVVKSDIILIPGSDCGAMMDKAAELYHLGVAPIILPSGGYNSLLPEYDSECQFLSQIALERGVRAEDIIIEDKAKNTFENATLSWKIMESNSIDIKSCMIVCKEYHSRRALLTYMARFPKYINFKVCTVLDKDRISKDNWFQTETGVSTVMGEVAKIGLYFRKEIDKLIRI